jgi:single-strand DNA-binding protein
MNSIEFALVGRIGRDPELKHSSQSGNAWTALSIGVGKDDQTQWVRVSIFGDQAEQACATLRKGSNVYVEGRDLRLDSYTGKDGTERHGLKGIAAKVELVGAGAIGRNKAPKQRAPEGDEPAPASTRLAPTFDDQIPFAPQVL